ncbi:hypothetical protein IWZ00DRAFT_569271 [Phyllosticta capitalensis]
MSSLFLRSSYQQYKEDTNLVASWLASTARSCGYPKDLLFGSNVQDTGSKGPGRLKGKARKQAKQPGNEIGENSKRAPIIAIKDFIALAEFIVGKKKQVVEVPSYLAYTLDRAIRTRKDHGALARMRPGAESSYENHSYFVGVLERVKEVLAPLMPVRTTPKPKPGAEPSADDVSNRFEKLKVEEPSQEFLNAPDVVIPERPIPEFEAEQLDNLDEVNTVFLLFLEDLRQIREVINNLWKRYEDGTYGLVALSLATNTAVDFARALENDLFPLLNKHGGSESLFQKAWGATCLSHGQNPNHREQPGDGINLRMYNEAENMMWNAYHFLNEFKKVVGVGSRDVSPWKPGSYGVYDPKSNRGSMTDRQKYDEDRALLMDFLPVVALHVRAAFDKDVILEDELIRGCRIVFETGDVSLWNVLSIQLFLDVHHTLRSKVSDAFNGFIGATFNLHDSLQETLDFHENLHMKSWPKESNRFLEAIRNEIILFVSDKHYLKSAKDTPNWPKLQHLFIWRRHLVFSGLHMYRRQAQAQKLGVEFANMWGATVLTPHLYHAGKSIFGERAPEGTEEYFRRYLLTTGTSAASLAKNSRRNWQRSKAGARGLKELAPLARTFNDRYCNYYYRYDLTPDHLKNILENIKIWEVHGPDLEDIDISNRSDPDDWVGADDPRPRRLRSLPPGKKKQDGKALQRLTAPALLKKMCSTLEDEKDELSFDYFRMHLQCWKLLRSIREKCHPMLRKMFGPGYLETESHLEVMVGYVLLSAVNVSSFPPQIAKAKKTAEVTSALLAKTAEAIEELVDRGEGTRVTGPPPPVDIDAEWADFDYYHESEMRPRRPSLTLSEFEALYSRPGGGSELPQLAADGTNLPALSADMQALYESLARGLSERPPKPGDADYFSR